MELRYGTVCTIAEGLSEETLSECIRVADRVRQPQFVPNKSVEFIEGDFSSYNLIYSDGELQTPPEPLVRSVFHSDILEEEGFHLHSYLDSDNFDKGIQHHQKMMSGVDEFTFHVFTNSYTIEREIDDVISSINPISINNQAGEMDAIELNQDGWNITILADSVETRIMTSNTPNEELKLEELKDEVESYKQKGLSKIKGLFE